MENKLDFKTRLDRLDEILNLLNDETHLLMKA